MDTFWGHGGCSWNTSLEKGDFTVALLCKFALAATVCLGIAAPVFAQSGTDKFTADNNAAQGTLKAIRQLGTDIDARHRNASANPRPGASPYQIDIDYSQTPELKSWVETQLRPTLEKWYPIIIADLPSEGFSPPQHFTVTLEANGNGVAATGGTRVTANAQWLKREIARGPQNEAVGALVHEAVHVVQQYGHVRGGQRDPGWLTEGIADYIRWWKFEPASARTVVRPVKRDGTPASYTDRYRTTAAFLEYVAQKHDPGIVAKLNAAGRNSTYSLDIWKKSTGKTLDELWAEFAATLTK